MKAHVLLVFLTRFEECMAMLKGIAHFERTHHLWTAFHDDQARSEQDTRWVRSKKWAGVISRHTTPQMVGACAERNIPLIDLNDCPSYPGVPKIRPDNTAMGHMGAEHFIERGYQKFGFCGFANASWSIERRDGFVEAIRLAGRQVVVNEVDYRGDSTPLECAIYDVDYPGDMTPFWDDDQISKLAAWIDRLPRPIALMACNDMRAQQVISAARSKDILVPEEVAVLGMNNDTVRCELSDPALSSVAPNAFQSGYRAAEMLGNILAGLTPKALEQRIEPVGVVTRHSTDILAVEDRNVAAALSYIRENACQGITVERVLQHAHASRSQLERKFRQHIGRSPQAEIRRVQLRKIRQLLMETDFPLKRIAELTGFEHMEYMCVLFKRVTGISPGIYRAKMQDKSLLTAVPVQGAQ